MSDDPRAFEYALGTLRGARRRAFERAMARQPALDRAVRYWEEQLMALQNPDADRTPPPGTWERIEQRLNRPPAPRIRFGARWAAVAALVALLTLPLGWFWWPHEQAPNTDYVAVLENPDGEMKLTAMTLAGGETLWLQWGDHERTDGSLQLWAVSRRDGQARSLAVFERTDRQALTLDQAGRRLIADAEYLLLTEEPAGGSPLDQPGERRLARGACVRLTPG